MANPASGSRIRQSGQRGQLLLRVESYGCVAAELVNEILQVLIKRGLPAYRGRGTRG